MAARPELSLQKATDFFKSATRNIYLVIWLVRIIAIGFLFLLINAVRNTLLPGVISIDNLGILFDVLILYFYVMVLAFLTVAALLAAPIGGSIDTTGNFANDYFNSARGFIFTNLFGSIDLIEGFEKDVFFGNNPDPLAPLAYLFNKPQRLLYNSEALHGFFALCLILMLITGFGFIRKSSVSLAGATLVISQIVIGLASMKGLTVQLELDPTSLSSMINSNLFQLAFISYIYFEFSLQTGYLYSLATPALSRQKRVGLQLSKLSEFRLGITKLGTEEEQASDKAAKERKDTAAEEEGEDRTSTALATGASSTTSKKFNADALLFLLDSASDSLFSKPGGDQERLTGRLQRYHDGLLAHDPKIDEKLGGSAGKAFNPFTILLIVLSSMAIRVLIIVFLAWFTLNPARVLAFIDLPQTVTQSLEINEPEGLLLVLIPLIFFLIGVSYFVTRLQSWIVKAEELIIKEADIGRFLKAGKAITSRKQMESITKAQQGAADTSSDNKDKGRRRRRKKKKVKATERS
ncbi:MAG: hypothetical protein IH840_06985 [Candidatus Heimdallarchaeota archaeon]|nr:hypothetical protein [Candidatus Heimdallarchaeota archaeon]